MNACCCTVRVVAGLERDFAMLLAVRRHRRLSVRGRLLFLSVFSRELTGFGQDPYLDLGMRAKSNSCIISVEVGWNPRLLFAKD